MSQLREGQCLLDIPGQKLVYSLLFAAISMLPSHPFSVTLSPLTLCGRQYHIFPITFSLGTQLNYISQPPLQMGLCG